MMGYMTARQAKAAGFTHHGSYYGIPVWVADEGGVGLRVAAKWAPAEYLMPVWHWIDVNMRALLYPDDPPVFQFKVGQEIR